MFPIAKRLTPLQLIGGGGHALVVAEAAQLAGFALEGFFDDSPSSTLSGVCPYLGTIDDALRAHGHTARIISVGDLQLRSSIGRRYRGLLATVIHPAAVVSHSAALGDGTYVAPGAIVNGGAVVGANTIVNTRAVVEHDCLLATNVHLGPGAILGGGVRIGTGTLIGVHASVRPNVAVGDFCTVGAGAVVVRDVSDHTTVVGVPARPLGTTQSSRARHGLPSPNFAQQPSAA